MKNYVLYRTGTGEILQSGRCQDEVFKALAGEGETILEGQCDNDCYVLDGAIVPMPSRPSASHVFDYATRQWVDGRTLDQIRSESKAKVVAWASATLSRFTLGYPPEEVLSWSAKLPAARRVLDGATEPMIEIEAKALGIPAKALAARVLEKGGQYEAIVALAAAIRGRTHAAIDAAPDAATVDAVLAAALVEATATLKAMGVA